MKKIIFLFALVFAVSSSFISCRETNEEREVEVRTDDVGDDIEDAVDDVGDDIEDAVDDVGDEID